eukprot:gb/GECG01001182.1/.p1 GENE.gb/GECG01001182.1/~~gb/GECG01001182.1/.p1  ORF type:complete len:791 (+),score=62.57 gb/GECG01001182.1/:1-2373(+)
MWAKVLQCLGQGSLAESVYKVLHVKQRDGGRRFDVLCSPARSEAVLASLRQHGRKWGWNCRAHIPFSRRRRGHVVGEAASVAGLKFGSYNVCGVRSKKEELRHFLRAEKVELVALQETLLKEEDWRMSLPGYHCFDVPAEANEALRGVAIVLKRGWNGYEVGNRSPGRVFVRVSRDGVLEPTIFGSIYIPQARKQRALREVKEQVVELRRKFPNDKMVLLGDWNLKAKALDRVLGKWGADLARVKMSGSRKTRHRGPREGIDHIVISTPHARTVATAKVLRGYDLSDHWPVVSHFKQAGLQEATAPSSDEEAAGWRFCVQGVKVPNPGVARANWPAQFKGIVMSNQWDALRELASTDLEEDSQAAIDEIGARTLSTCEEVAREQEVLKNRASRKNDVPLPRRIAKAISNRCKAYREARRADGSSPEELRLKWEVYTAARATCSALLREDRRKQWSRLVRKADADIKEDPRSFWNVASGLGNWRRKDASVGIQPVQDASGNLITDQARVSVAWREYYRSLASDVTGHSGDEEYWVDKVPDLPSLEGSGYVGDLNADISADELSRCLRKMKKRKAPGRDGIPAEFLQLCMVDSSSSMFRAILRVCNRVWTSGYIPESWSDSIIISIPKKGDLTLMSNYRGISLMTVCLKILMVLVTKRLEAAFEGQGLFSRSQAGFRKLEECPGQVVALYELLKRRQLNGDPSYILFVDLKKAYDTVPHGALFVKLRKYGVSAEPVHASSRIGGGEFEWVYTPLIRYPLHNNDDACVVNFLPFCTNKLPRTSAMQLFSAHSG